MFNVLILCTANSARSILAEAILNGLGGERVRAYSAGSRPRGIPHPRALVLLAARGHPTEGLRSKSWDEFSDADAPRMDLVITVCDAAAGEACPYWPGTPLRAHWGIPDPAAADSEGELAAFELAYDRLAARMRALVALPLESMPHDELRKELERIACFDGATDQAAGRALVQS